MKKMTLEMEPFDFDGLEAFFEEKAIRGFALHALEESHAVFERGEAAAVLYRVDYCADTDIDDLMQKYSELGWEYVLDDPAGRIVFRAAQGEKPLRIGCVPEQIVEKANSAQARDYRLYADLFIIAVTIGLAAALIYFRDESPSMLLGIVLRYLLFFGWWVAARIQYSKRIATSMICTKK